ncbi:MAG: V-type ATP synthase subunit E [Victivallales bacterium]|nr:V-type ATP synthase subunit E [Victivallales bacterium]
MEGQEKRLEQEILGDARQKAERIVARATSDAAAALKRARTLNERRRKKALDQARQEAGRKADNIVSGIWNEQRKMWLNRRERAIREFLDALLAELAGQDAASPARQASLRALASEALAAVPARDLTVTVAPADRPTVTAEWLKERLAPGRDAEFTVQEDSAIQGGIHVASADGRYAYDNTYRGRLARLDAEFRQILADCD